MHQGQPRDASRPQRAAAGLRWAVADGVPWSDAGDAVYVVGPPGSSGRRPMALHGSAAYYWREIITGDGADEVAQRLRALARQSDPSAAISADDVANFAGSLVDVGVLHRIAH